jgi:YVTN family beta-propeller protein
MTTRRPFPIHRLGRLAGTILLCFAPFAADAQQSYVLNAYIGNFEENTVSVIDTATNTLTGSFSAGNEPQGFAVTPDGGTVYVVNTGSNSVSVYDAASGTVTTTIPVGGGPLGAALTPNGALLYVANAGDGTISIIDTTTDTVAQTLTGLLGPTAIAFTPDGSKAYVTTFAPSVTVLDTATNAAIATLSFFGVTVEVTVSPDGSTAYVTADDDFYVIDTATNTVTASFSVFGQFNGVAVTPDGSEAWAANGQANEVLVIDAASNTVAATIPVGNGPNGVSFSADGTKAFVIIEGDGNVAVIDTKTRAIVDEIPVGSNASSIGGFVAAAPPAPAVAAAILPGGRAVEVDSSATVYATLINSSASTLDNCNIALPSPGLDGLGFDYQTTDPATNALIGSPNTPVSIAGNSLQTFILAFHSGSPLSLPGLPLVFGCDGSPPAAVIQGVDTVDLLFSPVPVVDIIALAATTSNNGVVTVPFSQNGAAAFAVASFNAGAAGSLTISTGTGDASLPIAVTLCQTVPSTGQCQSPPAATLPIDAAAKATQTFSFFVTASGEVPFAPGTSRIFVHFLDASGTSHGSTSVAVTTD